MDAARVEGGDRQALPGALHIEALRITLAGRVILDGITMQAPAAAVTALIGPNGAGKSTLLRAIAGLIPSAGSLRLAAGTDQRDLAALAVAARARLVAYVPQRSELRAGLTVENVVAMGRFAHHGALARLATRDRAAIDHALATVDAAAFAGRRFCELSCGEQQRVLIARALATEAHVLLLDEPTAALDVGHALDLIATVRRLASAGHCVIAALHHLDEVARLADHVVLIAAGRVAATGTAAAVLAGPALRAAYGVEAVAGGGLGFRRC